MRPQGLNDHPWRQAIANEVHARPIALVPPAGRVRRIALQMPRESGVLTAAQDEFAAWCTANGLPAPTARQHTFRAGSYDVTWELHTEFVTLTWVSEDPKSEAWPAGIGIEAIGKFPLAMATRIDLVAEPKIPAQMIPSFSLTSLCVSDIEGGNGQIATDFLADDDGFTRVEFATGTTSDIRRGVVVRRLLEIETYRVFALMGLPLARELGPKLTRMEADLSKHVEQMEGVETIEEAHASLNRLHALSVEAGKLAERTDYRFAASFAYNDVLKLRLERLMERSVGYASTIQRYLDNRIEPAIATCRAFEKRQSALAIKLDRAIGLLNTRIGLDLQGQNRTMLKTIVDTGQSQYRLQRTVEGLSTIAISYYALGILSYVLTGAGEVAHFSKELAVALAAPPVILLVWLGLRWVQSRHHKS